MWNIVNITDKLHRMDLNERVKGLLKILKGRALRDAMVALESGDSGLLEATVIRAWYITWLGFEPEDDEPKQLSLIQEEGRPSTKG